MARPRRTLTISAGRMEGTTPLTPCGPRACRHARGRGTPTGCGRRGSAVRWTLAAALIACWGAAPSSASADDVTPGRRVALTFEERQVRIDIRDGAQSTPFATYVFVDEAISRPYFCNLHTPSGRLVTRPRPLGPGDLDDHPDLHPGLWLAFGDLNGSDFWRLKAPVRHVGFVEPTQVPAETVAFAVRNQYIDSNGAIIANEVCQLGIALVPQATRLDWDSRFTPVDTHLEFGDQEEMGLGVRLASDIAEVRGLGGLLTDSAGRSTARNVWGQSAQWCDYSGVVAGQPVGVTIAGHAQNVRPCWWHARDYGFVAANPFGRAAMRQGAPSRIIVQPGEELRLRFSVLIHDGRPGDGYDPQSLLEPHEELE